MPILNLSNTDHPLADNFPLKKGSVTFTVPKHLEQKKGYIVARAYPFSTSPAVAHPGLAVLGDSGNISGPFAVV